MQASQASSSESQDESDALFPAANDPPVNVNTIYGGNPELSPPHSRETSPKAAAEAMDTAGGNTANDVDGPIDSNPMAEPNSDFAKSAEGIPEPGACWNNPKARDEYQRQLNLLQDRNFSLGKS